VEFLRLDVHLEAIAGSQKDGSADAGVSIKEPGGQAPGPCS
jgi:hypothetical protein